ncbi:MAG: hypothetical protein MUF24_00305 [Chitinophagaceae bacterium]|jgi:hypothetical protein|nr:hypothetical protein [Chitinophagaceae bacterium]
MENRRRFLLQAGTAAAGLVISGKKGIAALPGVLPKEAWVFKPVVTFWPQVAGAAVAPKKAALQAANHLVDSRYLSFLPISQNAAYQYAVAPCNPLHIAILQYKGDAAMRPTLNTALAEADLLAAQLRQSTGCTHVLLEWQGNAGSNWQKALELTRHIDYVSTQETNHKAQLMVHRNALAQEVWVMQYAARPAGTPLFSLHYHEAAGVCLPQWG